MKRVKLGHKILTAFLALLMLFTSLPIAKTYAAGDETLGQVSAITESSIAEIMKEDQSNITVTYNKEITLDWSPADEAIGRTKDGWWVGIKMTAPNLDLSVLQNATYESFAYGSAEPIKNKSFWGNKDSKDTDAEQYITLWAFVNKESINNAISSEEGFISTSWSFDWNNNGIIDQTVTTKIAPESVKLNKDGKQVYPVQPGTVTAITEENNAVVNAEDSSKITVSYKNKLELNWSAKEESIGRTKDGWWTGIKMTAPKLDSSVLRNSTYDSLAYGTSSWIENKSFWSNKDSKETDEEHYITLWAFVNEEELNDALLLQENIETSWRFDWNKDGIIDQIVTTVIDPSLVVLNKDSRQIYPSTELGSITGITGLPKVENDKSSLIKVSYDTNVTLQWSKADSTIGRNKDGWWAGIKMTAPEGADLENAKYKSKAYGASNWVTDKEFSVNKDGDNYITLWACVDNQDMLDNAVGSIATQWGFDWNNDGVYEQYVNFELDSNLIILDPTNLYAMDKNPPVFLDITENAVKWINEDTVISGRIMDTEEEYSSGLSKLTYSFKNGDSVKTEEINWDESTGEFIIPVSNSYEGVYTITCADKQGNESSVDVKVMLDKEKPEFSGVTSDITNWVKGSVKIEGTVQDVLSKVKSVEYSQGKDGTRMPVVFDKDTGVFSFEIPSSVTYSGEYYIYCEDNAGNKAEAVVLVNIDNEKCIVLLNPVSNEWTNKPVTVTGSISDRHSGIGNVFYRKSLEEDEKNSENITVKKDDFTVNPESNGNFTFNLPEDNYEGNYTVYGKDKVGNASNGLMFEVKMDKTLPVVNTVNVPTEPTNQDVTVSGTVTDNLSGIKKIYYKLVGDDVWSEVPADKIKSEDNKNYEYSFVIEAQNYNDVVQVYCVDGAGNESEVNSSALIMMDTEAPSPVEITYSSEHTVLETIFNNIFWFFNPDKEMPCTVTLSSTDNLSGVKSFEYSLDGGKSFTTIDKESDGKDTYKFIESEKSADASFSIAPQFKGKVSARATDKSGTGNTSELITDEKTIVVDNSSPEITVEYTSQTGSANYVDKDNKSVKDLASAERVYYNNSVSASITIEEENFFEGQVETVKDKDGNVVEKKTVHEVGILVEKTVGDKTTYIEYLPKTAEGAQQAARKYSNEYAVEYIEWSANETLHTAKIDFADDADYKLIVEYTDYSNNSSNIKNDDGTVLENQKKYESKLITVDTIAPIVEITYKDEANENRADDSCFTKRTATITVKEHNFAPEYLENNISIIANDILTAQGVDMGIKTKVAERLKEILVYDNWNHNGNVHTFNLEYADDAIYDFDLNSFKDYALNEMNPDNENKVKYADGTASPKHFVVDTALPSDVKITYTSSINVVEDILGKLFWFYNPEKNSPCKVTLTTTDMTSGLQCFTYSYNGNYTDIQSKNIEDKKVAEEKGFEVNKDNPSEFTYSFEIPAEFRGKVTASAIDNAGNTTAKETESEKTIIVDTEAPGISVDYSDPANAAKDNPKGINYYSGDVTVTVTVDEENFMDGEYPKDVRNMNITTNILGDDNETVLQESYKINNWARDKYTNKWVGSFTLSTEGDYTLNISYSDKSDNLVSYNNIDDNYKITIDKTAPVVEVGYYNNTVSKNALNNKYFDADRIVTIKVTEHNFNPEYIENIKDIVKAVNAAKEPLEENDAYKKLSSDETDIKNIDNWTKSGDVYKYEIPFTTDANYTFTVPTITDYAKNTNDDKKTAYVQYDEKGNVIEDNGDVLMAISETVFTVDKKEAEIAVTTEKPLAYKVLEGITFGFFDKSKVTITVKDATAGLQKLSYKSLKTKDSKGDISALDLTLSDMKTSVTENGYQISTYEFPVDDEYKDSIEVTIFDNSGNESSTQMINSDTDEYNGIVVDKTDPKFTTDNISYNAVNTVKDKHYYSSDARVTFKVDEEYFYSNYYETAADAKAGSEKSISALAKDVTLEITKDGKYYYAGSAVPKEEYSALFKAELNEKARTVTIVIPSMVNESANDGDFVIKIGYTDLADHYAEITTDTIVIDTIAPVVSVEFDSNIPINTVDGREYYNTNRSAIIKVTEHNFFSEYFDTEILKAQNILGNEVTNYIDYFKDKNGENWTVDPNDPTGNTHIIKVDFKSDANYTFDFELEDLAKNKFVFEDSLNNSFNDYPAYLFTVDKTSPENLKVSYSSNVFETVINAITFGYYDSKMNVTISADDDTSGVYHFMYSYLTAMGVSDVNAQLVNDAISKAEITRSGKTSTAVFSIPKSSLERNSQFNGTVEFTAYDYAENNTYEADTKRVIVDNISPTASITFNEPVQNANNVSYYAGNIDATISINEANFYPQDVEVIVTKDGSRYPVSVNWVDENVDSHTGTFRLTDDGDYVVTVVYSDRSGNAMATYESNQLTIDTADPVITVSGLNHQSANNDETIGFSVSVTDKNIDVNAFKPELTAVIRNGNGELETIKISLGEPVTSVNDRGETVYTYTIQNLSVDGFYSLICSAVDYANHSINIINSGNDNGTSSTEETMNFSVNREGSTFWIETTHNDKYTDKVFSNELDKAYANDNVEIIVHELNVDQVNISNNSEEQTVFALHDGSSTGYVTLQEGTGSNGNYVKNTLRGAGGWYETRYTLNNDNFAHDGIYSFSILSFDRAGNSNLNTKNDSGVIKFTVDRTNPVITSNISENQVIDADSHTVEFEINDTNHDTNTVEVTLNGKVVPSESITDLGGNTYSFEMSTGSKQSVSVTSKDMAGNTAEQYEIKGVTVSTNGFVLFYYSHTILFWTIIAGIVLLACLILLIMFKRKKDEEEEEA